MENTNAITEEISSAAAGEATNFPVPMSIEELQQHLVRMFLLKMRTIALMTSTERAWSITGKPLPEIDDPDFLLDRIHAESDSGFTYEDIRDTQFATCMETIYQYAYFGVIDDTVRDNADCMEYGSFFTHLAGIVYDMANSHEIAYRDETENSLDRESAVKCYHFIEAANARCILENQRNFLHYDSSPEEDPPSESRAALSVPQMALLAGMGEMTIRAAANPKRANPLKTYSDNGRTRIAVADAKAWLQSKGRYIPITRRSDDDIVRLMKRKFASFEDFSNFFQKRIAVLADIPDTAQEILMFDRAHLSNPDVVQQLAEMLKLPYELFSLRIMELITKANLAEIERKLKTVALSHNTNSIAKKEAV